MRRPNSENVQMIVLARVVESRLSRNAFIASPRRFKSAPWNPPMPPWPEWVSKPSIPTWNTRAPTLAWMSVSTVFRSWPRLPSIASRSGASTVSCG